MTKTTTKTVREVEYERPLVVASYFGFEPIKAPRITDEDLKNVEHCLAHPHYDASEKAAFIRTYLRDNLISLPHPLMVSYKKFNLRRQPSGYSLHFVGAPTAIAEASLIRTTLSILSEEGHKNLEVNINCVGDKESMNTYERELGGHLRKWGQELPEDIGDLLKKDVFNIFRINNPEISALRESIPPSINFLSNQSRLHFKEVLESLESLGIEFHLKPELVGEKNHSSHTIFAVRDQDDSEGRVLAVGYRYNRLGRKLGLRKEVALAGANIIWPFKETIIKTYKNLPRSRFYLVQLGREAKMKALSILDKLRQSHIRVHHFLGRDKLDLQLTHAESLKVSHIIIIGHKEAIDNTATIRNVITRAQDTISADDLPSYLKNIDL